MKAIRFLLLLFVFSMTGRIFAQDFAGLEPPKGVKVDKYRYIFIGTVFGGVDRKVSVFIPKSGSKESDLLRTKDGKDVVFDNLVVAFNYLGERGWEYTSAFQYVSANITSFMYVFRQKSAN